MNKYCVVFGRRSLAAAMRNQVEPSRSDGLCAAGALWVGGHCFSLPLPHYFGHHSPRLPLWVSRRLSATSPSLRLVQGRTPGGVVGDASTTVPARISNPTG
jgi:hypothetical protein